MPWRTSSVSRIVPLTSSVCNSPLSKSYFIHSSIEKLVGPSATSPLLSLRAGASTSPSPDGQGAAVVAGGDVLRGVALRAVDRLVVPGDPRAGEQAEALRRRALTAAQLQVRAARVVTHRVVVTDRDARHGLRLAAHADTSIFERTSDRSTESWAATSGARKIAVVVEIRTTMRPSPDRLTSGCSGVAPLTENEV